MTSAQLQLMPAGHRQSSLYRSLYVLTKMSRHSDGGRRRYIAIDPGNAAVLAFDRDGRAEKLDVQTSSPGGIGLTRHTSLRSIVETEGVLRYWYRNVEREPIPLGVQYPGVTRFEPVTNVSWGGAANAVLSDSKKCLENLQQPLWAVHHETREVYVSRDKYDGLTSIANDPRGDIYGAESFGRQRILRFIIAKGVSEVQALKQFNESVDGIHYFQYGGCKFLAAALPASHRVIFLALNGPRANDVVFEVEVPLELGRPAAPTVESLPVDKKIRLTAVVTIPGEGGCSPSSGLASLEMGIASLIR